MNRAFGAICLAALAVNMIAAPLAHATETAAATLGAGLSILDSESVIGYSQDGRPLVVQHLGDGGASVFVMGGQHGGPERNTVQLARLLFDHLAKNPDLIPQGLR
ncbi:MAG: peptidase carboxypeptidase, partial [Chloroflexi bacterium]|nr:peptidase carboxypeptidase [Chloroflexota bacterium]